MYKSQTRVPNSLEKMELQKRGHIQELTFELDGDEFHIDEILKDAFPEILQCGGYVLMRQNGSDLIHLDPPNCVLTVKYLRDVLLRARLFIRPIQMDIEEKQIKQVVVSKWLCTYGMYYMKDMLRCVM